MCVARTIGDAAPTAQTSSVKRAYLLFECSK
jgi:hypothetical protein